MIVLADNDVLFNLARCDLFQEFLAAFELAWEDVRILPRVRYSVRSKGHRKRLGAEGFARLNVFLYEISDIDVQPDFAFIVALNEQADKNIDAGEAALFAACPMIDDSVIATGDTKSLAGLVAAASTDETCARLLILLAGRVICFEQILSRILEQCGFEAIRQKLIDGRECDRGLALWLGSGLDATKRAFAMGSQAT